MFMARPKKMQKKFITMLPELEGITYKKRLDYFARTLEVVRRPEGSI